MQVSDQTHQGLGKVTLKSKHDENRKMLGAEWTGKQSVTVNPDRLVPMITDAQDAIIKVTSTAICGSDLHMYVGAMPGMTKGDLMGHEVSADHTCNRSCSPNRHALCTQNFWQHIPVHAKVLCVRLQCMLHPVHSGFAAQLMSMFDAIIS